MLLRTTVIFLCFFSGYFIFLQSNALLNPPPSHSAKQNIYTLNNNHRITAIPDTHSQNEEVVALGKLLFFDTRLSKNNSVSCASCHNLHNGGVDGLEVSSGIFNQTGTINSPTVLNSSLNFKQFWDGRANTLEDQIDGPINSPIEMNSSWPQVITKLNSHPRYLEKFAALYPLSGITKNTIKNAIASYERSLLTPNSRFDLFLKGQKDAINATEKQGYQLFINYGCIACHQGVNAGGNMFSKIGIMHDYIADRGNPTKADLGRYQVTQKETDKNVFKVPGLRNIEITGPYFHDGKVKTLESAVAKMAYYQLGIELPDNEVKLIVSFLKTLTGKLTQ